MSEYPRMSDNDPPTVPVQPEGFVTQDPGYTSDDSAYTSDSALGAADSDSSHSTTGQSKDEGSTGQEAKAQAGQVASTAAEQGQQVAGEAKAQAGQVAGEAKAQAGHVAREAGDQVKSLAGQARDEVTSQADYQKARAAEGIRGISGQLTSMADGSPQQGMAMDLVNQASQRIDGIASWVENREPADMLEDVRTFARQRPGVFLAAAAGAGLLAGRMTKGLKGDSDTSGNSNDLGGSQNYGGTSRTWAEPTPVAPYPTTPAPGGEMASADLPDLEPRHLAGGVPSTTGHLGDDDTLAGKRAEESRGQAGQW